VYLKDNSYKGVLFQKPEEHIQPFAYRIHQYFALLTGKKDIPDSAIFPKVLLGLHPSVVRLLPFPTPATLADLFKFGESLSAIIPPDDPFWPKDESTRPLVSEKVSETELAPNRIVCYRCNAPGHVAFHCKNQRRKGLRRKTKKNKRFQQKRSK
jgi:hypothetical protein